MSTPTTIIRGYHAHVYFDAQSVEQARQLCEQAASLFGVSMGRVHTRPVGPHPKWSCQLAFSPVQFTDLVPWLALNRQGLDVLVHPVTTQPLTDHRDRAMWLGHSHALELSQLSDE